MVWVYLPYDLNDCAGDENFHQNGLKCTPKSLEMASKHRLCDFRIAWI